MKKVEVARMVETEAVIASGLEGDETVVIDGQDRLREGGKVSIKESLEAAAAPRQQDSKAKTGEANAAPSPAAKATKAPSGSAS